MTNFWHPFANMAAVAGNEVRMVRGEGSLLWDDAGTRYLDATSSLWYCNVGYGRTEIADAVAEQMRSLAAYSTFGDFTNDAAETLAAKVCAMSPVGEGGAAFFASGGSDAVDSAAKLARRYWAATGQPRRTTIVARSGGYHGVNAYGTSLGGLEPNRAGFGHLVGDIVHVPYDDVAALAQAMEDAGDTLAAVMGELVQGAGGVRLPPDGYWTDVDDLVAQHGCLLIVDEVITGFGRLGHAFASERFGLTPDFIIGAKGITSGYLPLGVVIAAPHIREALWSADVGLLRHGFTYSGHATVCAAGMANIGILEREDLYANVLAHEAGLASALDELTRLDVVRETRSIGFMAAVELDEDAVSERPSLVEDVVRDVRSRGVLTRNLLGHSLQVSPPLITGPDEFAIIAGALGEAFTAV
jgi:adenosylmethionine-8-amino-7-oxononanoate aminotransferase